MVLSPEDIRKALSCKLPGSTSHAKMLPPGRELIVTDEELKKAKKSSVLLLLFNDGNELTACLIKRPRHMKFHPGQVAMPGGRIEKGERKLETALRETEEEIGIAPDKIEILGSLSELYVSVSRFLIHPFVGWLKERPQFILNKHEVEKTILFPVSNYKNKFVSTELKTVSGKLKVPCVKFENETIWGATAMILSEFFDVMSGLK